MSYEGYSQFLCKKGHLWHLDCMEDETRCPICKGEVAWKNSVDVTNGSFYENKRIDGYVELKVKKITCCDKCGTILETTYHIPRQKKHKARRGEI